MTQEQQKLYDKLLKKVNEYCLGAAAEDVIAAIDALVDTYEYTGETSIKVLDAIKEQMPLYDEEGTITISKTEIRTLENSLKALEIIKEKRMDIYWLQTSPNLSHYNLAVGTNQKLKKAEYELLKEILK
jgi:hypothetical protein